MARKEIEGIIDEVDFGVFTINETSVGKGGYNKKRSDVQLVQFFLRQFYKNNPDLFKLLPKTNSSNGQITIDGYCGGQTSAGIYHFQRYQKEKKGSYVLVDALVDVPKNNYFSSISNTVYTIYILNTYFASHGDGKKHHGRLENHPDVIAYAPELRAELSAAKATDLLA